MTENHHEPRTGGGSAEAGLLSDFLHLISESGVRMVFWVCPKGCRGAVAWNDDKTDATCQVCGVRKSDNATQPGSPLTQPKQNND